VDADVVAIAKAMVTAVQDNFPTYMTVQVIGMVVYKAELVDLPVALLLAGGVMAVATTVIHNMMFVTYLALQVMLEAAMLCRHQKVKAV
jgi:hypothetical protein